jgi:plastocyanin
MTGPTAVEGIATGGVLPTVRRIAIGLAALTVGFGAAALAVAQSGTPEIDAVDFAWVYGATQPAQLAITPEGSVGFAYPSGASHHFPILHSGPAAPSCSGLPTSAASAGPGWSGSCTFSQAGTYVFYCGVHGAAMQATVYVNTDGTLPATTTTTTTAATETTPPTYTYPPAPESPTTSTGSPTSTPSSTQPSAPAAGTLSVRASQRGASVSATLRVALAGAMLDAELRRRRSEVGRLVRRGLVAGVVRFAVALSRSGAAQLRQAHALHLMLTALVQAPGATDARLSHAVTLHT